MFNFLKKLTGGKEECATTKGACSTGMKAEGSCGTKMESSCSGKPKTACHGEEDHTTPKGACH